MQKEKVILKAKPRGELGKSAVRALRRQHVVPAVLYGKNADSVALALDQKTFETLLRTRAGTNVVLTLQIEDAKKPREQTVIVKEVQLDPVSDAIDHVDFHVISLTEKLKVKVQVQVKGESVGVKEGGVLDVVQHEIEVECLPSDIPARLEVDVTALKMGDAVHAREIAMPRGVTCLLAPDDVVIAVHAPRKEEVAAPAEAPSEPEVVGKEKKEKEGEEAPAAAPKAAKEEKEKEKEK